jgi:hypothetical protein
MPDVPNSNNPDGDKTDGAVPFDDSAWFDRLKFVFAKTMPQIPHEYVVRTAENEDAYVTLWKTINERGAYSSFGGRRYKYWYRGDGWRYWFMGGMYESRVINRARVEGIEGNGHELFAPDGAGGGKGAA